MTNTLEIYLKSYLGTVSDKSINLFKAIMTYREFSKGDTAIEYGKPTSKFYILEEGLVGSFITDYIIIYK